MGSLDECMVEFVCNCHSLLTILSTTKINKLVKTTLSFPNPYSELIACMHAHVLQVSIASTVYEHYFIGICMYGNDSIQLFVNMFHTLYCMIM